jgi:hypothetical protein
VHDAVAYLVAWGLEHRTLGPIRAIGVDEIQYGKGHLGGHPKPASRGHFKTGQLKP